MPIKQSFNPALVLAGILIVSGSGTASGQDPEIEKLRSEIKAMQGTIQILSTNLANANARLAELEKLAKPEKPASITEIGVPPSTSPGALPDLKTEPSKSGLADATTPIRYRDTIKEDDVGAARVGNAPLDPTYQGFMRLFGTETWVKLGGYAKLDAITDSTKVGNPNIFITSQIPVEGEPDFGKGERFTLQAKQTRLSLELRSPTKFGSLKIYYENDFFNDSAEPTMDYRLRQFYGQLANILAGQTWSAFNDVDSFPDTLDFAGPNSLSVVRQPQLRYTIPLIKDRMNLAFAVEQPNSDVNLNNLPDGPGGSTTADGRNKLPDFTSRWRLENKSGHVQVSGVLRSLSFDETTGLQDTKLGWGMQVSGAIKTWGEDNLLANFIYGDGIGRYIQDLPADSAAVVDATGHLHTLTAWGGMVAYRHQWSEKWRSTASYGYVQLDNLPEQGNFAYGHTHYAQGNLIWAMTKNVRFGIEYLYGLKQVRNGNSGDDHRFQASLQYRLVK